jgi:RNA polymerase sigma-70 factor (ECF subfamily)
VAAGQALSVVDDSTLAQLLARCALNDQTAARELYRQCAAKLFAVITRILQRTDWSEEVLQETFLAIWRHAGDYRSDRSQPMTWMTSIARHRALDRRRGNPEPSLGEQYQPMIESIRDDTPELLERLLRLEQSAALARCMNALDANSRQAIALAYFHGLTHSEAAAQLVRPIGSVKTWIRRGLQALRECLSER